ERAAGLEDAAQPVAHHGVVVGDQQPDRSAGSGGEETLIPPVPPRCAHLAPPSGMAGRLADTAVPAPGSDSISSCPASRLTRCRIAIRPKPPVAGPCPARCTLALLSSAEPAANPTPSSRTARLTPSSMSESVTPAR